MSPCWSSKNCRFDLDKFLPFFVYKTRCIWVELFVDSFSFPDKIKWHAKIFQPVTYQIMIEYTLCTTTTVYGSSANKRSRTQSQNIQYECSSYQIRARKKKWLVKRREIKNQQKKKILSRMEHEGERQAWSMATTKETQNVGFENETVKLEWMKLASSTNKQQQEVSTCVASQLCVLTHTPKPLRCAVGYFSVCESATTGIVSNHVNERETEMRREKRKKNGISHSIL